MSKIFKAYRLLPKSKHFQPYHINSIILLQAPSRQLKNTVMLCDKCSLSMTTIRDHDYDLHKVFIYFFPN